MQCEATCTKGNRCSHPAQVECEWVELGVLRRQWRCTLHATLLRRQFPAQFVAQERPVVPPRCAATNYHGQRCQLTAVYHRAAVDSRPTLCGHHAPPTARDGRAVVIQAIFGLVADDYDVVNLDERTGSASFARYMAVGVVCALQICPVAEIGRLVGHTNPRWGQYAHRRHRLQMAASGVYRSRFARLRTWAMVLQLDDDELELLVENITVEQRRRRGLEEVVEVAA